MRPVLGPFRRIAICQRVAPAGLVFWAWEHPSAAPLLGLSRQKDAPMWMRCCAGSSARSGVPGLQDEPPSAQSDAALTRPGLRLRAGDWGHARLTKAATWQG